MAKRKRRKAREQNPFGLLVDFVDTADAIFLKLTGKDIPSWLKEFQQQPRELPPGGGKAATQEPAMPLADAYAVLGLPLTATLEEVKGNYKRLAAIFHPDKGGYKEAMVLLNNAYDRIKREMEKWE